jgi:hypothetical protein
MQDDIISRVEARLADWTKLPASHQEDMQVCVGGGGGGEGGMAGWEDGRARCRLGPWLEGPWLEGPWPCAAAWGLGLGCGELTGGAELPMWGGGLTHLMAQAACLS